MQSFSILAIRSQPITLVNSFNFLVVFKRRITEAIVESYKPLENTLSWRATNVFLGFF